MFFNETLQKIKLVRVAEENWNMRLSYYIDQLGNEYVVDLVNTCAATGGGTDGVARCGDRRQNRLAGVETEKREILGGFFMGLLCGSLWSAGDIANKLGNGEGMDVSNMFTYVFIVLGVGVLIGFLMQKKLGDRVRRRQESLKRDLPDFITNIILLIQSGVNIMRAFHMAIDAIDKDSPLKTAGQQVAVSVQRGMLETEALEGFADACRIIEASRLVSVIIQNFRKGGNEITPMLRVVANECWEERKNIARKRGEEASAKLLLPMMLLLLAILCIVVTPAALTLMDVA